MTLQEKSLATIELPKILEMLAAEAATPPAKELCRQLRPETSLTRCEKMQEETDDASKLIGLQGSPAFSGVKDISHALDRAEKGGFLNPVELLARVKSQLRRYLTLGGGTVRPSTVTVGGIALDDDAKTVTVDGERVNLTPIEYDILRLLMQNAGKVYSPQEIYRRVWHEAPAADNPVAVHVRHIREKIEINPKEPKYLKVVWGIGYKII